MTLRKKTYPSLAMIAGLALAFSGCSNDSAPGSEPAPGEETTTVTDEGPVDPEEIPEEDPEADLESTEEPDASDAGEQGTVFGQVIVDGVGYDITTLRNCEPLQDEMLDRELELQAIGDHDGSMVIAHIYVEEIAGTPFHTVSWSGPEGVYGEPVDSSVQFSYTGSRVSGTSEILDALTFEDSVTISFDLPVPDEVINCGS